MHEVFRGFKKERIQTTVLAAYCNYFLKKKKNQSISVDLVSFCPIRSRSVNFDPFWSSSVNSVHFHPFQSIWSRLIHFGTVWSIQSTLVQFSLFSPIWPIAVYSIQFGPIRSFWSNYDKEKCKITCYSQPLNNCTHPII